MNLNSNKLIQICDLTTIYCDIQYVSLASLHVLAVYILDLYIATSQKTILHLTEYTY